MSDSKPVLGYWAIRGLAQPIRLLLNYVGEDFEDKKYELGPAPDYNADCWMNEKYKLGLDFPNLPYFIDGDIKITQSNAILRYIARRHNMCGETDKERAAVDVMEHTAMDFRNFAIKFFYSAKEYEKAKPKYFEDLKKKLAIFEKYMDGKKFFIGDKITFVDFPMYELLDQHRILDVTCLEACPNLKAFMARFEELPKIQEYMSSDKFMKNPINNKMAAFGAE